MKCIKFSFLAGIFVVLLCLPALASTTSSILPLDSPIYPALDKLSGLGMIDSSLQGTRPYTRLEAARQVSEALQNVSQKDTPLAIRQLLDQLESVLQDQLVELGALEGIAPASYLKPVRELQLEYIYQDGEPSSFPGTNASQFALNYNNYGIDYANHHNGQLILFFRGSS